MKKLFYLTLIFAFFLNRPLPIHASDPKFEVENNITYKVFENAPTKVTENFQIKNLTTAALAKEYLFKIKNRSVSNVRAFDRSGELTVEHYEIDDGTEFRIQFRKLAPGIDNVLYWSLTYEMPTIAEKIGRLWKITMPKTAKTSASDKITVNLQTPESFGPAVLTKPEKSAQNDSWFGNSADGQIVSYHSKDKIPYQAYSFKLKYRLNNSGIFPITKEIALPPDTAYQKIFLEKLVPKPKSIRIDSDGNWLASFNLKALTSLEIEAVGQAAVFSKPENPTHQPISNLTKADKFWETNDQKIVSLAQKMQTVPKLYNFVVGKLAYDQKRSLENPSRLGAALALKTPLSAICTEFTDLLITLLRAKGIPSREINGFAFATDQKSFPLSLQKDILHAWVEYEDPQTKKWLMVDPTWEKTSGGLDYLNTFDFNHLALAIHGQNSQAPSPAGFYKETGKLKKYISQKKPRRDVFVSPENKELNIKTPPTLQLSIPDRQQFYANQPTPVVILVKNNGQTASMPANLEVKSKDKIVKIIGFPAIPPFSQSEKTANLILDESTQSLTYNFAGQQQEQTVKIVPAWSLKWILNLPSRML